MAEPLLQALNLIGTVSSLSDRSSYVEDPEEALLQNKLEALQELYAQHGTIGPNPNYDEEGNIIPIMGYPPDIATTPFMSRRSLAAVGSKMKDLFIGSPRKSALQTADILAKIERKLTPKLATKTIAGYVDLADEGRTAIKTLSPTKFSLFVENQTRKSLLRKLSTPEEYTRFKKTFSSGPDDPTIFNYDEYKRFLEMELYPSKKALEMGVDKFLPHIAREFKRKGTMGRYDAHLTGRIEMRPFGGLAGKGRGLSEWRSTLRHELKHHLDFELTGYGSGDYERLRKVFDEGLRPEIKEELLNWKLLTAIGGKLAEKIPGGVKRINYLKEPTETLARLTEIRTKGAGQKISTLLGRDITALRQLKSIYKPEFLKTLMKDYWAITPVGLGIEAMDDEDVYKSLK